MVSQVSSGRLADLGVLVEAGGVVAGQVLLEHLEVLAGERLQVVVGADQRRRLQPWMSA